MHAAVDDVHHRHRQQPRRSAADITVQRQLIRRRGGLRHRKRYAENGIGAEPALVRRAVEPDHGLVDLDLRFGVHAGQRIEDLAVDGLDRGLHALAEVARLVVVAQFHRLVRPGRSARRHAGAPARAVFQDHVDFDGGIAAAVENFAADDVDDGSHGSSRRGFAGASTGSRRALSPTVAEGAGAGVGLRAGAEFAVEFGYRRPVGCQMQFRRGGGEREFAGGAAPLTVKFEPGSAWNTAPSAGLLTQSCAQASRPRNTSGMPSQTSSDCRSVRRVRCGCRWHSSSRRSGRSRRR